MAGTSKAPPKPTPLSVICRSPAGNPIVGVTLEVIGLRREVSKVDPAGRSTGRVDYLITDQEVDNTRASPQQAGLGLGNDECLLNIIAFVPGSQLGPNSAPFQPGGQAAKQIRFKKGSKDFGPDKPVELILVHQCLFNFTINPALLKKRVRNLTVDEAYQELVHRHQQRTIRLIPEPTFDAGCVPQTPKLTVPRSHTEQDSAGKTIVVEDRDSNGARKTVQTEMVNMSPRIGAVDVLYNDVPTRTSKGGPVNIVNVNPINAAGLVRLVLLLNKRFAITEFHHVGIGRSVIINKGDCHDWGRAIDYVGVRLPDPAGKATPFFMFVQGDWAKESVPTVAQIGKRPSLEDRNAAWPFVTQDLEYRFLSMDLDFDPAGSVDEQKRVVFRAKNDDRVAKSLKDAFDAVANRKTPKPTPAELDAVRAPMLAERKTYVAKCQELFQFIFDWCADNYAHMSPDPDPAPSDAPEFPDMTTAPPAPANNPMGKGGRIMHPDHRDTGTKTVNGATVSDPSAKNGREAHNSHYHIQVGPTGATAAEIALL
jgi:hypothetical protein